MDLTFSISITDNETGKTLKRIEEKIMAMNENVRAFAAKIDEASSKIAAKIQALINKQSGIGPEDQAEFDRLVAALEQLGKSEDVPVVT